MIKNIPVQINTGAVKDMPKISKEIERLERELKKSPKNKDLLDEMKEQKEKFEKIEGGLADGLKKLNDLHKDLSDQLATMTARKDLPDSLKPKIDQLSKIIKGGRAAELKDLATSEKREELHSNPSKLTRVAADLSGDGADFNKIEEDIDAAIDKEYAEEWKKVEASINKLCSDAKPPVRPEAVNAVNILKEKFAALKKARYKDYEKKVADLNSYFKTEIANAAEKAEISTFRSGYPALKGKTKLNIIDDALAKGLTAADTKKKLDDALVNQRKPSKAQWTQYLGMTGYTINGISDKYDGLAIHVTFDKNSWGKDSDGGICVASNSADVIMDKLFGSVDWTYQLHATLEIKNKNNKQPHVYWDGTANHWDTTAADNGKDQAWQNKGKAKLTSVLAGVKADIKTKIQKAIELEGAI